jgi:predicted HicB family RNase H-like nuclease
MHKTETLNLRVSPEFKRRLTEEAIKEKRSLTNYIEAVLSNYWDLKSSKRRNKANIKPSE